MNISLFTIGVYGTSDASFFRALADAGITDFVDVRRRRGLRGHLYAYANAAALQARLAELGIRYQHRLELSPTVEIRATQLATDHAAGVAQRERATLDPAFANRYEAEILAGFDAAAFLAGFPNDARVVLFCVEHSPHACHRSVLADRIAHATGVEWHDITPAFGA